MLVRFLPEDASGDWFYHTMEILGALVTVALILVILNSTQYYSESHFDSFKCYYIIVFAFLAALIVRPSISRRWILNFMWVFSFYIETFAIVPQLMLFIKKGGEIEDFTGHFVASLGFSRVFSLFFWISTYNELNVQSASSLQVN